MVSVEFWIVQEVVRYESERILMIGTEKKCREVFEARKAQILAREESWDDHAVYLSKGIFDTNESIAVDKFVPWQTHI
jgi:hypothetical protein